MRVHCLLGAIMVGLGLAGCTGLEDNVPLLPKPSIQRCDPAVLDAEQQKRQDEVDRFVARFHRDSGWMILDTQQTYGCDIIDYLDPASVPGSEEAPPPEPEYELPPEVLGQGTEIDSYPELRGPAWSVPVMRPAFAPYVFGEVEAISVEAFIAQTEPGTLAPDRRLYAGIGMSVQNSGAVAFVNGYDGKVQQLGMSLLEMAVRCPGVDPNTTEELVGVAVSRDRKNFDRAVVVTRLQVEFLTAGYMKVGPGLGGWEGAVMDKGLVNEQKVTGFVGVAGAPYGPGVALLPVSTVGGPIYESRFEIRNIGGNWWIAHNKNWLGYYPREAFDLLPFSACQVDWYGEVYDYRTDQWDATDMGSGHFAADGLGNAAHFRLPQYLDSFAVPQWPDGAGPASPNDPQCYTSSGLLNESATLGPRFERIMYLGGPGGASPGCK